MKVYDLSHPVYEGMKVFPGTPSVEMIISNTIETHGFRLGQLILNEHAGTHLDAPCHYIVDGTSVADYDINIFVGPAVIIDLSAKPDKEMITSADFESYTDRIQKGSRVLIRTGWSQYVDQEKFYTDFPPISLELAEWLVQKGVILVGLEAPTLNSEYHSEVHRTFLSAGVAVIESMSNLQSINKDEIFLVAAPLKVKGADGIPIRALGIEF